MQKKERALKQKQRQAMRLNDLKKTYSFTAGNTRSCRARRPVSYTYGKRRIICTIMWNTPFILASTPKW